MALLNPLRYACGSSSSRKHRFASMQKEDADDSSSSSSSSSTNTDAFASSSTSCYEDCRMTPYEEVVQEEEVHDNGNTASSAPALLPEKEQEQDAYDDEIDAAVDAILAEAEDEEDDEVRDTNHKDSQLKHNNDNNMYNPPRNYRGLVNLGNTCYMASALQMLATCDDFVMECLKRQQQQQQQQQQESSSCATTTTTTLREAFLDVVQRLVQQEQQGEQAFSPVSPDAFKRLMDERSPLFVGYDQQDAHEFVTTLLDLMDEDYKKDEKEKNEKEHPNVVEAVEPTAKVQMEVEQEGQEEIEEAVHKHAAETSTIIDHPSTCSSSSSSSSAIVLNESSRKKARTGEVSCSNEDIDEQQQQEEVTTASSSFHSCGSSSSDHDMEKKKKTMTTTNLTTACRNSFSELNLEEEIGHLVHGDTTAGPQSDAATCSNAAAAAVAVADASSSLLLLSSPFQLHQQYHPPRCKLVGGRMTATATSASGVWTTPYESSSWSSSLAAPMNTTTSIPTEHDTVVVAPLSASGVAANTIATTTTSSHHNNSNTINSNSSSSQETLQQQQPQPTSSSPVDAFFKMSTRVRLTCDSCHYSRCHEEDFWHLSLEIDDSSNSSSSVQDGLRRFFAPEKRDITCERCSAGTATQHMEITQLPKLLLLHLKRFVVQVSPDYASVSYRKNQSVVSFDSNITVCVNNGDQVDHGHDDHVHDHVDVSSTATTNRSTSSSSVLSEFLAPDCRIPRRRSSSQSSSSCYNNNNKSVCSYGLRSVVNHMGASASCGHYTADAFRNYREEDCNIRRAWTRFNDASVTRISDSEAIDDSQRTAYLILYEME